MDGVIADFDKYWEDTYKLTLSEARSANIFIPLFVQMINNEGFIHLDKTPWADQLISDIRKIQQLKIPVEILSSTGGHQQHRRVGEMKRVWLQKHGIEWPTNFVMAWRDKKHFADPSSILIDDQPRNLEQWSEAGGIAINITTAFAKLKEYHR